MVVTTVTLDHLTLAKRTVAVGQTVAVADLIIIVDHLAETQETQTEAHHTVAQVETPAVLQTETLHTAALVKVLAAQTEVLLTAVQVEVQAVQADHHQEALLLLHQEVLHQVVVHQIQVAVEDNLIKQIYS